jgi:hypothetical protein
MITLTDYPLIFRYPVVLLLVSFLVLWLAAWVGALGFRTFRAKLVRDDLSLVQGATLTLLALIIGFTFSMALNRYDQRKNYEEEEANAIGTEFLRADLLPAAEAAKVRSLLRSYLDQRILYYTTREEEDIARLTATTDKLESELWTILMATASAQPTPTIALAVGGLNDVFNTRGYTQAAWWNRIPIPAWTLMSAIAICATMLVGIGVKDHKVESRVLAVLPLVISIAFFLIADIDTPRRGTIRVVPQNLLAVAKSLPPPGAAQPQPLP